LGTAAYWLRSVLVKTPKDFDIPVFINAAEYARLWGWRKTESAATIKLTHYPADPLPGCRSRPWCSLGSPQAADTGRETAIAKSRVERPSRSSLVTVTMSPGSSERSIRSSSSRSAIAVLDIVGSFKGAGSDNAAQSLLATV
jgi:hypothetical protein